VGLGRLLLPANSTATHCNTLTKQDKQVCDMKEDMGMKDMEKDTTKEVVTQKKRKRERERKRDTRTNTNTEFCVCVHI
jgi:hypothetical protein